LHQFTSDDLFKDLVHCLKGDLDLLSRGDLSL